MVVGTGKYENRNEAYPLDKKVLNQVAFRSLFVSCGKNAETAEANGWCWAMMPALKKIHENESDLALCMGQNLEYVETGGFFAPMSMGIILALESQKADLEVIRSVRTSVNMICNSLSSSLIKLAILSTISIGCLTSITNGNMILVAVFAAIAMIFSILLRFIFIRVGYNNGTKMVEKMMREKDRLNHACKVMGVFSIGALLVLATKYASPMNFFATSLTNTSMNTSALHYALNTIPSLLGILTTGFVYYFLVKKNWSIGKCVLLVIGISLLIALTGFALGI